MTVVVVVVVVPRWNQQHHHRGKGDMGGRVQALWGSA
jgi:hypothetical protein